jgi:hypothetical protein
MLSATWNSSLKYLGTVLVLVVMFASKDQLKWLKIKQNGEVNVTSTASSPKLTQHTNQSIDLVLAVIWRSHYCVYHSGKPAVLK